MSAPPWITSFPMPPDGPKAWLLKSYLLWHPAYFHGAHTHSHTHTHALGLALPATVVPPQHKLSHQCMLAAWLCGLWLHACRSVCMSNEQELMIQTLLEAI